MTPALIDAVQAERVADDERLAADPDRARVAERRRDERGRRRLGRRTAMSFSGWLTTIDAGRRRSVGEGELDRGRVGDDVEARQDVAGVVDDDAGAEAAARAGVGVGRPRRRSG